ncbi:LamG domain-containing protein, partial [Patescibacteria group bacterium]|nr:LamG domain-containing protein [Patescibacteria group bacterium]
MPQGITATWNDYARDASDIADPMVRGMRESCVGLWVPTLGATGNTLFDVSGFDHGTLTNMATATAWVPSSMGTVLSLDGTNEYIDCGQGASFEKPVTSDAVTLSMWANLPDISSSNRGAFGKHNSSSYGYALWINGGNIRFVAGDGDAEVYDNVVQALASHVAVDEWHCYSATYGHPYAKLYIDGVLVDSHTCASNTGIASVAVWELPFKIGAEDYVDYCLQGYFGPAVVSDRAFTPAEIRRLHEDPHCLVRKTRF